MQKCLSGSTAHGRTAEIAGLLRLAALGAAAMFAAAGVYGQAPSAGARGALAAQSFAMADGNDLTLSGGKAEVVDYQGRKAVRLTTAPKEEQVFAVLKGATFQDGTIEADIAVKTTVPPGVRMPGFVGIAFRAREDSAHHDMFYLRPGNARSEDQTMRNHSVQYVSAPDNDWHKLRTEWPWVYESWADLQPEHWSHVRIEVHGRSARLFVNGSESPSLIVDGLKGEDLQGGIALWGYAAEEAYFANVKVTPATPEAVTDGGEATGSWDVLFTSDSGRFKGTMDLTRDGAAVKGTWSGDFGDKLPLSGTWRNGYVELKFDGTWPETKSPATAILAGWVDGDAARGRMSVVGQAMGAWSATRKK